MLIAFRVDASNLIGTGHVMRCLTLAHGLAEKGASIQFMARHMPKYLIDIINARGFRFKLFDKPHDKVRLDKLKHAKWLGTSQEVDAKESIQALDAYPVWDWIIVDHYALDFRWQSVLRTKAKRIMVIDDIADRVHDCDILLDQNSYENMDTRYTDKSSDGCSLLLGPHYALLQPAYAKDHHKSLIKTTAVKRIFIYFGGVDDSNLTGITLDAFLGLKRDDISVDVVLPPTSQFVDTIKHQIAKKKNMKLYIGLPSLAGLMKKADLAIGAGGATTWERLCLALPSIVVTVAENQGQLANYLAKSGVICYLGNKEVVNEGLMSNKLQNVLNMQSLVDWSTNCYEACDGQGVSRVIEKILVLND